MSQLSEVPVGTITAWILNVKDADKFADLPDGWVRCDGSIIPHGSIWAGKQTPDLNNEKRFLRGATDKEMLTLEDDQIQDHEHIFNDPGHTHPYVDRFPGISSYFI